MTRSGRVLLCLPIGALLLASSAVGQEKTSEVVQKEAVAESILAREEAASGRPFDAEFRANAKGLLAALPLAQLESHAGQDGLGLNSLGDSQADLVYTPVTPCRIIDTRLSAGGMLVPGVAQAFKATGATTDFSSQGGSATGCGIPSGATAVAVNFGATESAGPGNLRAYPWAASATVPNAAVLNFGNLAPVGLVTMPNGSIVPICDPGTATCTSDLLLRVFNSATHVVADVTGYFKSLSTEPFPRGTVEDVTIPAAGMTPVQLTGFFFTPKSYGNVLVQARGYCNMGPAGAVTDDAIELGIGADATDAFNDAINPPSQWGVLRIPVNSGAHTLMFSVDRVWPTGRGFMYFLGLFGRHASGSVADTCSATLVALRYF